MISSGTYSNGRMRDMGNDEPMEHGKIYHATYAISGFNTYFTGWENAAMGTIMNGFATQGCDVTYIGVNGEKSIDVQFKMMDTGNARSAIFWMVPYVVCIAVIAIIAYLLIITIVGAVKEVSNVITENPAMIPIIYGGIAIVGLIAVGYVYKQIKGE